MLAIFVEEPSETLITFLNGGTSPHPDAFGTSYFILDDVTGEHEILRTEEFYRKYNLDPDKIPSFNPVTYYW